jgi:flagellar hook-basal body complex protein FliE
MPALPIAPLGSPLSALGGLGATAPTPPTSATSTIDGANAGGSFAGMLTSKLGEAMDLQTSANQAAQAVVSGQSDDLSGATIAVEKASIAMDLVGAVRNKALEAYQEVLRMQV